MKRIFASLIVLLCLTGSTFGATRKVQYVDTDVVGGAADGSSWTNAYATMFAWEAQDTGLVVADKYLDVYFRGATADTGGAVNLLGWTTSAVCYINIQCDPNNYHNGAWNTNCYRLIPTNNTSNRVLLIGVQYVTVDGLQISESGTATIGVSHNVANTTLRNCIIYDIDGTGIDPGNNLNSVWTYNNIVDTCTTGMYGRYTTNGCGHHNNTIVNCTTGIYAIRGEGFVTIIKNNLFKGNTTAWSGLGSGGTLTTAKNYTSDATSPDAGCGSATITFAGASDFHLDAAMSGTLLGTDLSGTFTTDIDGETRVSWYAGADEWSESTSTINNWWWRRRNQP